MPGAHLFLQARIYPADRGLGDRSLKQPLHDLARPPGADSGDEHLLHQLVHPGSAAAVALQRLVVDASLPGSGHPQAADRPKLRVQAPPVAAIATAGMHLRVAPIGLIPQVQVQLALHGGFQYQSQPFPRFGAQVFPQPSLQINLLQAGFLHNSAKCVKGSAPPFGWLLLLPTLQVEMNPSSFWPFTQFTLHYPVLGRFNSTWQARYILYWNLEQLYEPTGDPDSQHNHYY